MGMAFICLSGAEARTYTEDIAGLRIKVFWDFPYLYEGTLDEEKKYLETYFKAKNSFIFLVKDGDKVVGATTGIWAMEEEESFRKPFELNGFDPQKVFYFGESILLPEYRGHGFGKLFFQEREAFARTIPSVEYVSFCAVIRPENHPLRPQGHRSLDTFWDSQGFKKVPGMITSYEWLDRGDKIPTSKELQFWMKSIKETL